MASARWPPVLVGAGFPLAMAGELMLFAGDQPQWDFSEWWGAVAFACVLVGLTALWIGCVPLARQLESGVCWLLGVLSFAPSVLCGLGTLMGYVVINIHFWTATLVFVLPALWPVGIVFLRAAAARKPQV